MKSIWIDSYNFRFETQLQERDELHKEELQTVTNHKNQLEEDFLEVKTKMEQQLNIQEKEYEDLKAKYLNLSFSHELRVGVELFVLFCNHLN